MKLLLLTVCCVVATTLAGPLSSDKEKKLETALNDIEIVLQDLNKNEVIVSEQKYFGDIPMPKTNSMDQDMEKLKDDAKDFGKDEVTGSNQEYFGDFPKPKSKSMGRDIEEILLHTKDIAKATAEIEAIGGKVKIQMGHDLLIAKVPADVATKQDTFLSASFSVPSASPAITLHNARAYEMYRKDKLGPQPKVQKWTEKTAPKAIPRPSPEPLPENYPYTYTLRGKIAVSILVASGPGNLTVSTDEFDLIYSEVLRGLEFWEDNAPADAGLSFVVYRGKADIDADNGAVGCQDAECHDVFANPTMDSFGFSTKDEVAQYIKDASGSVGAYLAFFSKYRQSHFAYAYFYGGPMYMQYGNDGWKPNQIDRVFAHETGHVFNAPDEYTSCSCQEEYGEGACTARNTNCVEDNNCPCTYDQQPCIMDSNDLSNICDHTRKHVGWC